LLPLKLHEFYRIFKKFLDLLENVREIRKKLLALIVEKDESEKWCMSKHLLASSMRLFEVGNRLLHEGKEKEAKEMYKDSAELYGLFWALNVESKGKIKINEDSKETKGIFASIKKLLECCIE